MRVAFEVEAVLEGSGFAFIAIDRHQARPWIGLHEAPLLAGRKAGAAKALQASLLDRVDDVGHARSRRRALCPAADSPRRGDKHRALYRRGTRTFVSPARAIARTPSTVAPSTSRSPTRAAGAPAQRPMQGACRTRMALGSAAAWSASDQPLSSGESAADRVAHSDRERRGRRLAFLHDVEVIVKRGDLVNLGLRQPASPRRARAAGGAQKTPTVLDEMEVFDEKIAPARPVAEERSNFGESGVVERPAFRPAIAPAPAGPEVLSFSIHLGQLYALSEAKVRGKRRLYRHSGPRARSNLPWRR